MMMNTNLATKVTLCLFAVAALVATSMRSKDAFANLRGSPTSIRTNTGARKLQLGLVAADFNQNFKSPPNTVEQAVMMSFALNPLSFAPPAPAPVEAAPAPAPLSAFAMVSNNDGSKNVQAKGITGENGVVEAEQASNNQASNGSGRTSGTAFGDSTIGNPTPAPEPKAPDVLSQFKPQKQKVSNTDLFGAPKQEAKRPLTAQEQSAEYFSLIFSGNP